MSTKEELLSISEELGIINQIDTISADLEHARCLKEIKSLTETCEYKQVNVSDISKLFHMGHLKLLSFLKTISVPVLVYGPYLYAMTLWDLHNNATKADWGGFALVAIFGTFLISGVMISNWWITRAALNFERITDTKLPIPYGACLKIKEAGSKSFDKILICYPVITKQKAVNDPAIIGVYEKGNVMSLHLIYFWDIPQDIEKAKHEIGIWRKKDDKIRDQIKSL